ncbi:hypothetical protein TRVL_09250 [Trypanosoma vivax]|nr:hypothetical protein TRVL_09250 [Trypanosoma vivax]
MASFLTTAIKEQAMRALNTAFYWQRQWLTLVVYTACGPRGAPSLAKVALFVCVRHSKRSEMLRGAWLELCQPRLAQSTQCGALQPCRNISKQRTCDACAVPDPPRKHSAPYSPIASSPHLQRHLHTTGATASSLCHAQLRCLLLHFATLRSTRTRTWS